MWLYPTKLGSSVRKQMRGAAFFMTPRAQPGDGQVTNTKVTPLLPGPSEQPFLLSRSQVAKLTGFSEASVIRWENSGLLRPIKIGIGANARVRYAAPQVYALMEGQR